MAFPREGDQQSLVYVKIVKQMSEKNQRIFKIGCSFNQTLKNTPFPAG
jgi:hypothetical protein